MEKLIAGLEKFISLVKPEENYNMSNYNGCVIGKTVGWESEKFTTNRSMEVHVLNEHFGIDLEKSKNSFHIGFFATYDTCPIFYTENEWKVIRLFTGSIYQDAFGEFEPKDYKISGYTWLSLANKVLVELKEQNV